MNMYAFYMAPIYLVATTLINNIFYPVHSKSHQKSETYFRRIYNLTRFYKKYVYVYVYVCFI